MSILDKIKKIFRINHNVVKGEIDEVMHLNVTDEDKEQAEHLSVLVVAGMAACGIPCGVGGQQVIARILSYALRDLKDGIEVHDKLIIGRVVNEIKKEKQEG